MLIECIGTPVNVDGKPLLKDFRLYIDPEHRMRFKMKYLFGENEVPVDIVVYRYSIPKLDKLSLGITAEGKEMTHDVRYKIWLGYNFLDRKWTIKGTVGVNQVKHEMSTILEIVQVVKSIIEPYKTPATQI